MSKNKKKNTEEEIDLGSLFLIIGKGFSKLFNFIENIFVGIFHFFITILIFFKESRIKIGLAVLTGLVVGIFLETNKEKTYASDLILEPNFKSTNQLYNTIAYYNDLLIQKDTLAIQKIFKIDKEMAGSLKEFKIEPIINDIDLMTTYNSFVMSLDSVVLKDYTFSTFKESLSDLDYKTHKITAVANKSDVFNRLNMGIISSIIDNKYFTHLKKLSNENLQKRELMLLKNLGQVDSLRKVYTEVMLYEAKKQTSGTNIDLGGEEKK